MHVKYTFSPSGSRGGSCFRCIHSASRKVLPIQQNDLLAASICSNTNTAR